MGDAMTKHLWSLPALALLLLAPGVASADDPMNPTQFSHQVRQESTRCNPRLRIQVAVARVHDNQPVGTPFGRKVGGMTVQGLKSSSPKVLEQPERYDTSRDEQGYGKRVRELLLFNLASARFLQVVEREDINAIVREWDFGDTRYVNKAGKAPTIEMPQYIVKGFITANDGSCDMEDDTEEDAWDVDDDQGSGDRLLFLLRMYDIRTARVQLMACGTGNNASEAVKAAVKDLKDRRDLLFPSVYAVAATENTVELDGGSNQGLAPGTRFYLVRTDQPKEFIEDRDLLHYVALCKVTRATEEGATAVIQTRFDGPPEPGDLVFYAYPDESW